MEEFHVRDSRVCKYTDIIAPVTRNFLLRHAKYRKSHGQVTSSRSKDAPLYSILRESRDTCHPSDNTSTANLYAVLTGLIFTPEGQVRFGITRINVATNRAYLGWQLMDQQSDLQLRRNVDNWSSGVCFLILED